MSTQPIEAPAIDIELIVGEMPELACESPNHRESHIAHSMGACNPLCEEGASVRQRSAWNDLCRLRGIRRMVHRPNKLASHMQPLRRCIPVLLRIRDHPWPGEVMSDWWFTRLYDRDDTAREAAEDAAQTNYEHDADSWRKGE